jgi:hypothetical protein
MTCRTDREECNAETILLRADAVATRAMEANYATPVEAHPLFPAYVLLAGLVLIAERAGIDTTDE